MTQVFAVFAVLGLACLVWLACGWLLLPGPCPIQTVVTANGGGEGLEQTIKGLMWLKRTGLWNGTILICDGGLNQEGLALAQTLARREGIEFRGQMPEQ